MKLGKNKKKPNILCIIVAVILISLNIVILLQFISDSYCRMKLREYVAERTELTEDGLIPFVAKIKRIEIGPNQDFKNGPNNMIYIIDEDGHLFYTYFDPELLLLEEGSYIKLFFDIEYFDNNIIKIKRYSLYESLEFEYYMNKYN